MVYRTLASVLDEVNTKKVNPYNEEQLTAWLNKFESQVQLEVYKTNIEELVRYDAAIDMGKELIIPEPFTDAYVYYLYSKIDAENGEIESHNNNEALFQTAYGQFLYWFNHNNPQRLTFKNW